MSENSNTLEGNSTEKELTHFVIIAPNGVVRAICGETNYGKRSNDLLEVDCLSCIEKVETDWNEY